MLADAPYGTGIRVSRGADGEYRKHKDVQPHSANHTPLMVALIDAQKTGGDVYACPYGCADVDHDDQGYCHHLIGFSPGREVGYEPLVMCEDGKRRVKPRTRGHGKWTTTVWEKCRRDDHLEWIQDKGWARVYRQDVPAPPKPEYPDDDTDDGDGEAAPALEQFLAAHFAGLSPEQVAAKTAAIQDILTAPE